MRDRWYVVFFWPVLLWGCVILAAYWPHVGRGIYAPVGVPERMVWISFLVLLAAIPLLSVVFPSGRAGYVFVVALVVLAISLGLAVQLHGGLHSRVRYRWVAVWALITPMLAWVSIAAIARHLTQQRRLAGRLVTVGGLYLLAIMIIATCARPLEQLYFLIFTYSTSLFSYLPGQYSGLFFPHKTYYVTTSISLGISLAAWGFLGIRAWTAKMKRGRGVISELWLNRR